MIPVKLQLKNFMSYRAPETLDFTAFDLAILNGDNGAGKSTLLEAITWALWGKSRASSDDDLVHQGQTSMWVEFIFDYEGNRYRVLRSRELDGRSSSSLEFQISEDGRGEQRALEGSFAKSWRNLTEATIKKTQEAIIRTLKLDYDLFVNSSYLRQGHADEFTVKIPAERKEILADILDLSLFDILEEKSKKKKHELEDREQIILAQIEELKERTGRKPEHLQELRKRQGERDKLEQELKTKEGNLKGFENDRRRFESIKKEVELLRRRYEEIASELKELSEQQKDEETAVRKAKDLVADKETIEKQFTHLKKLRLEYEEQNQKFAEASIIKQELRVIAHREEELQSVIERLKHITVCPTCLRAMSKKEAEGIIEKLKRQFEDELGPARQKLERKLRSIGFDENRLKKVREELAELDAVEDRKRELSVAEGTMAKSMKILQVIALKMKQLNTSRLNIEQQGKRLRSMLADFEEKQTVWEKLEGEIVAQRNQISILQDTIGGLKDRLSQIVSFEKQIDEKNAQLKGIAEGVSLYNELAASFGKKGVQAMIIEQTIPQLEEEANLCLQKVTGGRMQVRFITQKAKKTGEELMETLEIEISDELGARPYEQYSGGEAFRINFAIRVALAKLLALRAGAKLQFLVVDEGFGALDMSGKEDVVAAISGIREDFAKIVVITHIEEFKNLFPTRIEVTKDSSGSHIQVFAQ